MIRDGKATSFDIMLDEAQRVALLELISNAPVSINGNDGPLAYWVDMLKGLRSTYPTRHFVLEDN